VLPNGLTLVICERPEAPVFSYATFIDAGDVNDPSGQSGLAHMFEHLAFKGTTEIGTTDYAAEKVALAKVEAANAAYEAEYLKSVGRDEKKLAELKKAFKAATDEAHKFVVPNQFTDVAERNGASGLNAETGLDETMYFWSMPENRLELWAWLESGRLADVVPREFYKERDVVLEERRMRTDSNPQGRLIEQFLATAFVAHNYGRSGIGWPSEVSQKVLCGREDRGGGGGRREGRRGDAGAGEVFQPGARRAQARGDDDRRAEAVCGKDGGDSRCLAAAVHRGLPPAGLSQPRCGGV
jgi:predicted Zn-dependent peptidase